MDLKTGRILKSILENASDGVFTIHVEFTKVPHKLIQGDPQVLSTFRN
jgi:hypothetical protein